MPLAFPKIQEIINLALRIFPNEYWKDVTERRNKPEFVPSYNQTFCDVIQLKWKKVDGRANFIALCTIPCTPDHWDIVLAAILLSRPEFWKSTQNICIQLIDYFKKENHGLLHHDNVQNFNRDCLEYLVQMAHGTRRNKFFTDPQGALINIYGDILDLSIKKLPEETEEDFKKRKGEFKNKFDESVYKILNAPQHIGQFQEELKRLEEYVSAT